MTNFIDVGQIFYDILAWHSALNKIPIKFKKFIDFKYGC